MLTKKLTRRTWRKYRLIVSLALTVLLFLVVYYLIPMRVAETVGNRKVIKSVFLALVFGFLPFYILPWLKWVMGHENDWENLDGEPLDQKDNKV